MLMRFMIQKSDFLKNRVDSLLGGGGGGHNHLCGYMSRLLVVS